METQRIYHLCEVYLKSLVLNLKMFTKPGSTSSLEMAGTVTHSASTQHLLGGGPQAGPGEGRVQDNTELWPP